ncbi:MAG: DMT family transporter [Candidatus Neomarinimicrobiota bacterium]
MRPKVLFLYILLCAVWSTTWLVLKISLTGTPPILGVALRFSISAFVLWMIFFQRREKLTFTRPAIKVYLGFGVLNFATSYTLTYWGTQYIYSGLSAILWATLPIFVAIMAHFMLPDDPLTIRKIVGGTVGLLGTSFIFFRGAESFEDFNLIGVLAILLAVIIAAGPNVLYKLHHQTVSPLHVNVVAQTVAAVLLFPLSWILEEPGTMVWDSVNIAALLYLALFGTVFTWSVYIWLLTQLTVTQVSAVALIPPAMAALLGWAFLGETFTPRMMVGSILILLGVLVVNLHRKPIRERGSR